MKKYISRPYIMRYICVTLALFFNGLNITLIRITSLGSDPFASLNYAINSFTGIPMGTAMMLMNCIFLILCIILLRNSIGYGMIACTLILGNAADLWSKILENIMRHSIAFSGSQAMVFRIGLLIFSIIGNMFLCSFYLAGDVGMSPYDALGYIIEKLSKRKVPFKYARILTDCVCVIVGYFLSAPAHIQWQIIGIGTVFMALGTGPIMDFFMEHIAKPFYKKVAGEKSEFSSTSVSKYLFS